MDKVMPASQQKPFFTKTFERVLDRFGYVAKEKKAIALSPTTNYLTMTGSNSYDYKNGLKKPGNISFAMLRRIAKHDALIRICIQVIKKEVSQSEYEFITKKGEQPNEEAVRRLEELLDNLNSNGENIRMFWDKLLEDLLILDAGVAEKVFNAKGELVELVNIDGATIRPVYNKYGEMDPNRAYVQIVDEKVVAEFKINEIMYLMQSPQTDIKHFGYGLSPIESILLAVQASLQADLYNAQTFAKDNVPPGMIDLGAMSTEEAHAFIAEWNATVINDTQKLKFLWGSENAKKYTPFQQNNKDMQFIEYIDWLSRLKLSVYGLSTVDANLTQDVNRSTAHVQYGITKSRGVQSVKRLIEEYFNREIIRPMGIQDLEFRFKRVTTLEEKKQQSEVDKVYLDSGVVSPSYIANREGFDEIVDFMDEDLDPNLETSSLPEEPKIDSTPDILETTKPTGSDKTQETSTQKNTRYFKPLYLNV